jgi:hypothetical protein
MSRASQRQNSRTGTPRRGRALWILLVFLLFSGIGVFITATILVARASEDPSFREHVAERLGQKLGAEVELGPIQSRAIFFLSVPEVRISSYEGHWAVVLQRVTLELDWRLLLQREWRFHSAQVHAAELSLGVNVPTEPAAPPSPPGAGPQLAAGAGADQFKDLPSWLHTLLFRGRSGIVVDSIRIANLYARGPTVSALGPVFSLACPAEGRYVRGDLEWKLHDGTFQPSGQEPWKVDFLKGRYQDEMWKIQSGLLHPGTGEVRLTEAPSAPGEVAAGVSALNLGIETLIGGAAPEAGPVDELAIGLDGILRTRFPEVHRFRFEGTLRGENLKLGSCRLFEVLAGQTGEPRLAHLQSESIAGRIEWTPDLVRLYDLQFGEPGLVRLDGRLSVVASAIAGVFDLALPVALVGRFPAGKPQGFSYPAGGWSRAQLRVQGPANAWNEDLTRRLLAQIPPGIPVGPAPEIDSARPIVGEPLEVVKRERAVKAEELFDEFIRKEE